MTSASELFCNRRSRWGRTSPDLGFDTVAHERSFHHRRRQHSHFGNHRHGSIIGDPLRRSSLHARNVGPWVSYPENTETQGTTLYASSSSINVDTLSSTRRPELTTGNDRLPGAVLLARARLLERLRGVALLRNRNNGSSIRINPGAMTDEDFLPGSPIDSISQIERLHFLPEPSKRTPGLTQEALDSLYVEFFSSIEESLNGVVPRASYDCSICLESFIDGEKLIRLPCEHRFHSACLDPWVRTCGDCPYCRAHIAEEA